MRRQIDLFEACTASESVVADTLYALGKGNLLHYGIARERTVSYFRDGQPFMGCGNYDQDIGFVVAGHFIAVARVVESISQSDRILQFRDLHISRVVATGAGVIIIPPGLRRGRPLAVVENLIVTQRRRKLFTVSVAAGTGKNDITRFGAGSFRYRLHIIVNMLGADVAISRRSSAISRRSSAISRRSSAISLGRRLVGRRPGTGRR